MQLYTINATWVRPNDDYQKAVENETRYAGTVARILNGHGIDGFTIYQVDGFWQGVAEKSYKIEIATDKTVSEVAKICEHLRKEYNQDAVMLTLPDNSVEFIER